jgi:hypothetical protein
LNYGFSVLENESNEFPFTIELTPNKPHYNKKLNMIQNKTNLRRTYRVIPNFTNQTIIEFFSYLRFITYDEDMSTLLNVI